MTIVGDNAIDDTENIEDDLTVSAKESFEIQDRVGEYSIATTVHEKYASRPKLLKDLCLAQFVICYDNYNLGVPKQIEIKDNIGAKKICGPKEFWVQKCFG